MILSVFTTYFFPAIVLGVTGAVFGLLIAFCAIKFAVDEDTRIKAVTDLLPGYNCGACGEAGCSGLAKKIVEGDGEPSLCKPIKANSVEQIKSYLAEAEKTIED